MRPNKPEKPTINRTYLEDADVTGTGIPKYSVDVVYIDKLGKEIETRVVVVDDDGNWKDYLPSLLDEKSKITASQYINPSSKSDVVEWVFPPLAPELDDVHAGTDIRITGKGNPNYWIHMDYKTTNHGSGGDLFQCDEEGNFKPLNPILNIEIGDTVTVGQSEFELVDDSKVSKRITKTVIE